MTAFKKQVDGMHYKDMVIQPTEFSHKNGLSWCEANVVKYICRHKAKNGIVDLRKAIHYIEFLAEMNYPDERLFEAPPPPFFPVSKKPFESPRVTPKKELEKEYNPNAIMY